MDSVCQEELVAPLKLALGCVASQVDIYDWPRTTETMGQYKQLMLTWAALAEQPEVHCQV